MSQQQLTESNAKVKHQIARRQLDSAAARSPQDGFRSAILQLQRTLGNQHVAQLIQAKRITPEGKIIGLQRKLTVGAADDQYEQEADRVARRVMSIPDSAALAAPQPSPQVGETNQAPIMQSKSSPLAAAITPFVQREIDAGTGKEEANHRQEDKDELLQAKFFNKSSALPFQRQTATEEEEAEPKEEEAEPIQAKSGGSLHGSFEAGDDVESRLSQSKGGGSPLPEPVRTYMEPRFGVDFSHVRVHTDSNAIQMNRDVGAQAFTHGSDVYFGMGNAPTNLELTAHELTHVVQQTGATPLPDHGISRVALDERATEPMPSILAGQEKSEGWKGIEDEDEPFKTVAEKGIEDEDEPFKTVAEKCGCGEDNKRIENKGEHTSEKTEGDRLRAHELTHSIQRAAASPFKAQRLDAHRTAASFLQRQPAAPVPAPAAAPAGLAAVNFLPVLMDQAPAGWGVTVEDDPDIDITAFASGTKWKCVITKADQQAHQGVRLLPGVVEVTPALVAGETDCTILKTMITSLKTVANQGADSGFYMLAAVQAHEDLHIKQYRADLAPHFRTLRRAVRRLSVPIAGSANAAAAKAAIMALPAFTAAMARFRAGEVAANNKTAAHTRAASFKRAEHRVVDPMIRTIKSRRKTLKCPP